MTSEMNCTVATHRNFPTGYLPPHWLDQSHLERITSLCLPNRQSTCQIRFDQRSCICCDLRCFLFSYIYLFLRLCILCLCMSIVHPGTITAPHSYRFIIPIPAFNYGPTALVFANGSCSSCFSGSCACLQTAILNFS